MTALLISTPRVIGAPVNTPNGPAILVDVDKVNAYVDDAGVLRSWPEADVTAIEVAS